MEYVPLNVQRARVRWPWRTLGPIEEVVMAIGFVLELEPLS